jgi:hypothetical protein
VAQLLDAFDATIDLPGSGFFFETVPAVTVPASPGSTVFMPFTADWGPDNVVVPLAEWRQYAVGGVKPDGTRFDGFGPSDTVGRRRVYGAFLGEGLPGKGGAGRVLAYRMATSAAARAAKTLQNTAGTPANAITLTARYKGTRGNGFGLTHRPGVTGGTDELVLIEGGREVEVYPYAETDVAALAAAINAETSSLMTATSLVTGVALADVSNVAFTGGNDGTTLLVADYTAMLDAIEYEPFGVFAAAGVTDGTILAALYAWQTSVAEFGKPFFLVEGAAAAEAFSAHRTRALARNNSDAMVFGTGSILDSTLTTDGTEITLSTAEGVARLAGAIARRGELMDMVNVRFAGWRISAGATRAQALTAKTSGMTVLTRDGDPDAPTKINLGLTSYSSDTLAKPAWHYSNVKFVRTDHGLETDIANDQEHGDLIGELGVGDRQRDIVVGRAQTIVQRRIDQGVLQARSTVMLDPEVPIDDDSDEIALAYDIYDVRGLRKIRNRIRLH